VGPKERNPVFWNISIKLMVVEMPPLLLPLLSSSSTSYCKVEPERWFEYSLIEEEEREGGGEL